MKENRLRTLTIVIGSLVAFAIVFSQFVTPGFECSEDKAKTGQTQNERDAESGTFISLPAFSLPAPFHVQSDPHAYCLFEIFFEKGDDSPMVERNPLFTDRLFSTLFSVIISPNAP